MSSLNIVVIFILWVIIWSQCLKSVKNKLPISFCNILITADMCEGSLTVEISIMDINMTQEHIACSYRVHMQLDE